MIKLQIEERSEGLNLLLLGAHCDDIEIGAGGTILRLVNEYKINHIKWVVFASTPERAKEAKDCADFFLQGVSSKEIIIRDFRDGFLLQSRFEIKSFFEEIKSGFSPDLVLTHNQYDLHQDHKLLSELSWNTFRNHLILEYEIPKYDGDTGNPGLFFEIDKATAERKVFGLMEYYGTQRKKHWFDNETFYALLRLRGMQSACHYAEAFYSRKIVL